ncbi:hypothetical protein VZT92_017000 [Zoarces viviparus]|uniref:C2H2-type domain-containing protein n=1 Tax=Zoarces viviparus TaxID=48416 RepID=A0AAW1EQ99_ZOAVI
MTVGGTVLASCCSREHNGIHKGEKPNNCSFCKKSFSQLSELKPHQFSQKGEKPYQCNRCEKGFPAVSPGRTAANSLSRRRRIISQLITLEKMKTGLTCTASVGCAATETTVSQATRPTEVISLESHQATTADKASLCRQS